MEVNSNDIPDTEQKDGQKPVRYIDPTTGDMWVEYEDRPLNEEERAEELEKSIDDLWESHLESEGLI